MLERRLSRPAKCLHAVVAGILAAYVLWGALADDGLPHQVNLAQAALLGDHYYPKLTVAILLIPAVAIGFLSGVLLDLLTHNGMFKPPPVLSEDAKSLLTELQKRAGARLSVLTVLGKEIWSVNGRHFSEDGNQPGRWAAAVHELLMAGLVMEKPGEENALVLSRQRGDV